MLANTEVIKTICVYRISLLFLYILLPYFACLLVKKSDQSKHLKMNTQNHSCLFWLFYFKSFHQMSIIQFCVHLHARVSWQLLYDLESWNFTVLMLSLSIKLWCARSNKIWYLSKDKAGVIFYVSQIPRKYLNQQCVSSFCNTFWPSYLIYGTQKHDDWFLLEI